MFKVQFEATFPASETLIFPRSKGRVPYRSSPAILAKRTSFFEFGQTNFAFDSAFCTLAE
jgi:hypothetical protein